jgi:hypothetical protein
MKKYIGLLFAATALCGQQIEYSVSGGMNKKRFEGFKKKYNLNTFIETGTYLGNTTATSAPFFNSIYTIEISKKLYKAATKKLEIYSNIQTMLGSSEAEIKKIIEDRGISSTLIFLDAHYSAGITEKGKNDPPVMDELFIIADYAQDETVIILDDVRCFGSDLTAVETDHYPHLRDVKEFVESSFKDGFRFCIIGDQAIFYNPCFYNDEISVGVQLFTDLYLARDKAEFVKLAEDIPTIFSEKEKESVIAMANSPHPSAILSFVASVIQEEKGNTAAAEKYLNRAYELGLK